MKLLAIIFLFSVVASIHGAVKVSVYYEALCPDSIGFIKNQLYPTWLELTEENLEPDFVPYGKATQRQAPNGTWSFQCQHGPQECKSNMEQACALNMLSNNATMQVMFITCVMSSRSPARAGQQCASLVGISYTPIETCMNSALGGQLLAGYGDRTHSFKPSIRFVPTVAFNGAYSQVDQDDSMRNLLQVVCRYIAEPKPDACNN